MADKNVVEDIFHLLKIIQIVFIVRRFLFIKRYVILEMESKKLTYFKLIILIFQKSHNQDRLCQNLSKCWLFMMTLWSKDCPLHSSRENIKSGMESPWEQFEEWYLWSGKDNIC